MKHTARKTVPTLLFLFLVWTSCSREPETLEIVPVENLSTQFIFALLAAGVDTNNDGIISHAEAREVLDLNVQFRGLTDLNGIEAFTKLLKLNCYQNRLVDLDLSNNPSLSHLDCGFNQLTSLDVSESPGLSFLNCYGNELKTLDVSANSGLTYLACGGNALRSLNISGNKNLTHLFLEDLPDLQGVCVWTLPFPPPGLQVDIKGSPRVIFTSGCSP
ncbi:MAG: hypothetical protein P1P86_13055 [Bacteroidales bacterium]|nr:hypothetical protein [Bacteroidales bacterium]